MENKKILAWINTRCPYCGNAETVEVTEQDKAGKHIVRCPKCGERIPLDTTPPDVKRVEINEPEVNVDDKVDTGR